MKKNLFVLCVLLLSSCSSMGKLEKIGAPSWVFDAYSVGDKKTEVAGVGIGEKTVGGLKSSAQFAAKPLTNPIAGRYQNMKERLKPRFDQYKRRYERMGLPKQFNKNNNKGEK